MTWFFLKVSAPRAHLVAVEPVMLHSPPFRLSLLVNPSPFMLLASVRSSTFFQLCLWFLSLIRTMSSIVSLPRPQTPFFHSSISSRDFCPPSFNLCHYGIRLPFKCHAVPSRGRFALPWTVFLLFDSSA